ncbi:MAG: sel1 repeat family protein [Magnetococcales bacterium]|nr:sel1 repeat family protein [Magnetococcales bacterium]
MKIIQSISAVFILMFCLHADAGELFDIVKDKADKGDSEAQYYLGVIYRNGLGVPKNYHKAVKWFTEAAKQGNREAHFNLKIRYDHGEGAPYATRQVLESFSTVDKKNDIEIELDQH